MIEKHSLQQVCVICAMLSLLLVILVVGCDDSVVRLWSVSSGELLSSVPAKPNSAVCFSDNLGGVTGKPSLLVEDGNKIIAYPCSPFGPPTNKWSILQDF